jgi:hypothetical protein
MLCVVVVRAREGVVATSSRGARCHILSGSNRKRMKHLLTVYVSTDDFISEHKDRGVPVFSIDCDTLVDESNLLVSF